MTPEQLAQLLDRLSEVMAEAERLKIQVTRQLEEQRRSQQQEVTPTRPRKARKQR